MKIEIGELRNCLSLDLQQQVVDIIEKKQHDPNYFLLVWSDVDPLDANRINTKIFTLSEQPPNMLGTFCVHVNNEEGRMTSLWNLPLDIPTFGITNEDKPEKEVIASGMNMGWAIFNN